MVPALLTRLLGGASCWRQSVLACRLVLVVKYVGPSSPPVLFWTHFFPTCKLSLGVRCESAVLLVRHGRAARSYFRPSIASQPCW